MKDATKIAVYLANPVDTELIRLFEQRQCASNRDVYTTYCREHEIDADRLDDAIEMAQILRDHCIEKEITLPLTDVRFRIEHAVRELRNDRVASSVCYENAMNALLHGLEQTTYTQAS